MTEKEIRESIKLEMPNITDEFIDEFLENNNITIQEYKVRFDRALAARRKDNPNYPGKMPKGFVPGYLKHLKRDSNKLNQENE